MSDEGWRLVIEFPDQSASFASGVEVGKLWSRMKLEGAAAIEEYTMQENREVLRRIAEYLGWQITQEQSTAGWDWTTLTKIKPEGRVVNPHGLRIVPPGGS